MWATQWEKAGSGKKELAESTLPTSEIWLWEEETSWPRDSNQGGQCPTALPWGAQPKGTFMFWMPNSVSVNTMCFLFHAGIGAVIVRQLYARTNVSRGKWTLQKPHCHTERVWGPGPNFQGGKCPQEVLCTVECRKVWLVLLHNFLSFLSQRTR